MVQDQEVFRQIGETLAKHFDGLYYVDVETGKYEECIHPELFDELGELGSGEDFFADLQKHAEKCVYPEDLVYVRKACDKEVMLNQLSRNYSCSTCFRFLRNGKMEHIRLIAVMCEDKKHLLCCLESIEEEMREKDAQTRALQAEKRLARMDALTGIQNKNAFLEIAEILNVKLRSGGKAEPFGVVMCDVNDLKLINDTRGHSFGDEVIQWTSRMISNIYKGSSIFRIGGDEFVVLLTDAAYAEREELLGKLKAETLSNKHSRSGPVVACGLAVYDTEKDDSFDSVLKRADQRMYENKKELKEFRVGEGFTNRENVQMPIPEERKRALDGVFGALLTVAGGGYVFLNDMKYGFSRWSISLTTDFEMDSEYMYDANSLWLKNVHPEDLASYQKSMEAVLSGKTVLEPFSYRARRLDGVYISVTARAFVLNDANGELEYFGGIIVPV